MSDHWFAIAILLSVFLFMPGFWAWRLVGLYWFAQSKPPSRWPRWPRALVILPVRGADPSLKACLTGLVSQDYPDYAVRIVVDSAEDPAWNFVREVLAANPAAGERVAVEVVAQRRPSCSVKVSAQLQALARLDEGVEIVAFIDADSIPAPDWLRVLVGPLADREVGATSGIRWFVPADSKWGSWVRHSYNAASFTQMYAFHVLWGGSMAMRADVIRRSGILEHWSHCFCEDTSAYDVLRQFSLRVVFVPQATQFNQESVDLKGAYNFVLRQLLCVRLHHIHWPVIVAANVGNTLAAVACLALAGLDFFATGAGWWPLWAGLVAGYAGMMGGALVCAERLIRALCRRRGMVVPACPFTWKQLPAAVLTQFLSCYCIIRTHFVRAVRWRGITYAIAGRDNIRLLDYATYSSWPSQPGQSVI
jgi:hypothetical protein